jgi:dolichol-phosphate mannosyltransferase
LAALTGMEPALSIVVPALNEAENLRLLLPEIAGALADCGPFEIIVVDDGSTDGTPELLAGLRDSIRQLRLLRHPRRAGQSAAMLSGVRAARGAWIVTMDGDGQNDPADIPSLLALRDRAGCENLMVVGHRVKRRDTRARRLASRIAFIIRNAVLHDGLPDTGCSLKLFRRADFLELPAFNHMHRFLGALMLARGVELRSIDVNHRPRRAGQSKYTNLGRLFAGLYDLFGVRWLTHRSLIVGRPSLDGS